MVADKTAKRNIPTLGFFIPRFGSYQATRLGTYQEAIWAGITQVAQEYNANALCFAGAEMNASFDYYEQWQAIYDLASPVSLDGLIILSGILQNHFPIEEMVQFCARYAPLPMVSIGLKLEGIPSVTVDNSGGIYALIRHLVEEHHYRRIAFIQGPVLSEEAAIRYRAYTEALEECGISFDPDLVMPGRFSINTGIDAIRLLLDQRKADFEVVVACNDNMAIGAYEELTRRGFSVPGDVAITGFDDVPEAKVFAVPLTTIRQPLIEQGQHAAYLLLEYLRSGVPPENLTLGTELVVRESCGCSLFAAAGTTSRLLHEIINLPQLSVTQQRLTMVEGMKQVLCPHYPGITTQAIERLVDAFLDELQGKPDAGFLPLFSRMLRTESMSIRRVALERGGMTGWQEALSILRDTAYLSVPPDAATHMEDMLHQGRALITEVAERVYANLQSRAEISAMIRSEAIRDLNAEPTIQRVIDVLTQNLPRLGISTFFLALYEGTPIPPPLSKLIMAYHNGQRLELEPDGRLFPSLELIPQDMLPDGKRPFLMIRPLGIHSTYFGFVVMDIDIVHLPIPAGAYEEFSDQLGSVLYRALLQQQIERSNKDLQRRAAELAEANAQLEQFAYVASHDLQEPLRMITSYLQLVEKRYKGKLDSDAEEFIEYAVDGAARMKRMINDLLAYSRVTSVGQPLELTHCEDVLANALANLEIAIRDDDALVTYDPLPTVMGNSTQLMALLQNLIGNAIKFRSEQQPCIHISAEQTENEWLFSIRDNGIGIAPEHWEKIFDIFSRLHSRDKYPGSGIGLAICKKVVEQHGGRIWIESQPGSGTTFFFTIPRHSPDNTLLHHT